MARSKRETKLKINPNKKKRMEIKLDEIKKSRL